MRGGTGTHATEKEAKLIFWDPQEEEKVSEIVPVPGAKTIVSLAATQEGVLYGITDNGKVFIFDPEKREMKKVLDLGFQNPRDLSLQLGPNGMLYGLAKDAIFIIDPKTTRFPFLPNHRRPSIQAWPFSVGKSTTAREPIVGIRNPLLNPSL